MNGAATGRGPALQAYATMVLAMGLLDGVWLGLVAQPLYARGIGHLMAEQPALGPALAFYIVYPLGLLRFAVQPMLARPGWREPLLTAAAFGFFAYATYDLSNWATLKDWPASLAIMDMAWGALASTLAAAAGRWAWLRAKGAGRA